MLSAEHAISRFRRDVAFGWFLKLVLFSAAVACVAAPAFLSARVHPGVGLIAVFVVLAVFWFSSLRSTRLAAELPHLLAAGLLDDAESRVEQTVNSFSPFKSVKLLSLHQLAVLRHAQRRHRDSALICRTVLANRFGATGRGLSTPSQLMLARSSLALNDLRGAYEALSDLRRQPTLTLGESLSLLVVESEYLRRVEAWNDLLANVETKIQLAELLPSRDAARVQQSLSDAAERAGRVELASWLARRAELLSNPDESAGATLGDDLDSMPQPQA